MTENERVRIVRKSEKCNLTMEKFGERLGVTKTAISLLESGKTSVTDQMRRSICREFHINETWLRTGEGKMFVESSREKEIDEFLKDLPDNSFKKRFVAILASLGENEWSVLEKVAVKLYEDRKASDQDEDDMAEIDRKVEEYRQNLIKEKEAERESSTLTDSPEDNQALA